MLQSRAHPYWSARAQLYEMAHFERSGWRGVVVDLGGGDGFFSHETFPEAQVYGVEEDYERKGGNLDELLATSNRIFSAQVFEHLPHPVKTRRRLAKSLKAGSAAWIDVPNDFEGAPQDDFAPPSG